MNPTKMGIAFNETNAISIFLCQNTRNFKMIALNLSFFKYFMNRLK